MKLLLGRRWRWAVAFIPLATWLLAPLDVVDTVATAVQAVLGTAFLVMVVVDHGNRTRQALGAALCGIAWWIMAWDNSHLSQVAHGQLLALREANACAPSYASLLDAGTGWRREGESLIRPLHGRLGADRVLEFRIAGDGFAPYDGRRAVARVRNSRDGVSFPCLSTADRRRAIH